jgi:hypothetical protein
LCECIPSDPTRLAHGGFLPPSLRGAVAYRASKKQLLWDLVLASGAPAEAVLQRVADMAACPAESWDAVSETGSADNE